ncbi:transposase [Streptomyces decoyicus]|uniref:transposase n=1 Tax=Streptomyces decoyicus TaxID=249567 RepID=UPI003650BB55
MRPAVLVADTGYGANADFRRGLEDRGLANVLQAKAEMTAHGEAADPPACLRRTWAQDPSALPHPAGVLA